MLMQCFHAFAGHLYVLDWYDYYYRLAWFSCFTTTAIVLAQVLSPAPRLELIHRRRPRTADNAVERLLCAAAYEHREQLEVSKAIQKVHKANHQQLRRDAIDVFKEDERDRKLVCRFFEVQFHSPTGFAGVHKEGSRKHPNPMPRPRL